MARHGFCDYAQNDRFTRRMTPFLRVVSARRNEVDVSRKTMPPRGYGRTYKIRTCDQRIKSPLLYRLS